MKITKQAKTVPYWIHIAIIVGIYASIVSFFGLYGLDKWIMFFISIILIGMADIVSHTFLGLFGWKD